MKLSKTSFDYILKMIKERESKRSIIAFCDGLGIDTTCFSSPVCITDNKVTIKYRNVYTYYYI